MLRSIGGFQKFSGLYKVSMFLVTVLLAGCSATPTAYQREVATLQVTEKEHKYELTVPASRLILSLPKGQFVRAKGASKSPGYFMFSDDQRGLYVSGWIEPAHAFVGTAQLWESNAAELVKQGTPPKDVTFGSVGDWEVVWHQATFPVQDGKPIEQLQGKINAHLRAQTVRAGTWIELHLSTLTEAPYEKQKESITALLRTIEVSQKP